MKKPTFKQIRDRAYLTATSNHLVECFTYRQFQKIDVRDYVWEQVENWSDGDIVSHIAQIADSMTSSMCNLLDIKVEY
jgi:hypothetical protein